jgi:hypothetical protein
VAFDKGFSVSRAAFVCLLVVISLLVQQSSHWLPTKLLSKAQW